MSYGNYERMYENMMNRTGKANQVNSFKNWQRSAIGARKMLLHIRERYNAEREEILRDYSTSKANEILIELQRSYDAARQMSEKWLRERFEVVVQSKRDAVKAACKAPSDEDLRMLSALRMRSKLTESDVIHAAEHLSDNFVALQTLADIASSSGLKVPVFTADLAEEEIANAEQLGENMLRYLDAEDKKLGYNARGFYNFPDLETPVTIVFDALDENVFTSEQVRTKIESVKNNPSGETNRDFSAAVVEFREGNSILCVAQQFHVTMDQIQKSNPGMDLANLHPGDRVIVPSVKMSLYNQPGYASPDQVSPVQPKSSKLDPDIYRSNEQTKSVIKANGRKEITIGENES